MASLQSSEAEQGNPFDTPSEATPPKPIEQPAPADLELGVKPDEERGPLKERLVDKAQKFREEVQAKDPVKMGRCSLGTASFTLVGVLGLFLFGYGCAEEDVWEILSSIFLVSLSSYAVIFLGGDPCMLAAFREQVNLLAGENSRFKKSNDGLEEKLETLGGVNGDLEKVQKKLGSNIEAATALLNNMERFSALQTVSAAVNQFFAADWDGSGHINADEAQIFIPQLSSLWTLVPNFDQERLIQHVQTRGLTLQQFSVLLDCIVADDRGRCAEELEKIIAEGQSKKSLKADGREVRAAADEPAHLEEVYEEAALPNVQMPQMPGWLTGKAADDKTGSGSTQALKPWIELGPLQIWSMLHLVLMLCTVLGLTFGVASLVVMEFTNILGALLGVCLSGGLMAASRLIEVLRALRKQVGILRGENDRLESSHAKLSEECTKLSKLKKGLEVLQAECGGNVQMAQQLIHKSNTNTKMSAMAVVTRVFREADVDGNQRIDGPEVDIFVERLTSAFGAVPGFDAEKARVVANGLTVKELKTLVDSITTIEAAPETTKEGDQAAPANAGDGSQVPAAL